MQALLLKSTPQYASDKSTSLWQKGARNVETKTKNDQKKKRGFLRRWLRRLVVLNGIVVSLAALGILFLGFGPSLFPYLLTSYDTLVENQPEISFLATPPVIDGVLDEDLAHLPRRSFSLRLRLFSSSPEATYRLAYGADFLYLFVAVKDGEIICRDRGYQHGDGLQLMVSERQAGSDLSERYHVLGFSPQTDPRSAWAKKVLWYRDMETELRRLGDDVRFAADGGEQGAGYEALIPWLALQPAHPWLSDSLGLNLCFVKAVGTSRMTWDLLLLDWRLQAEGQPRRSLPMRFQPPEEPALASLFVQPPSTGFADQPLVIRTVSLLAPDATTEIALSIRPAEEDPVLLHSLLEHSIELAGTGTLHTHETSIEHDLPSGTYRISYEKPGTEPVESKLLILPRLDVELLRSRLDALAGQLNPGDLATLRFTLQRVASALEAGKLDDHLLRLGGELTALVSAAEAGELPLAHRPGVMRRAFTSKLDDTLQPYSVRIPEDFDPGKSYPLLVFLHGSGVTDERAALTSEPFLDNERFIQLFPYARGASHYYGTAESQTDIREAVEAACASYPIDTERVILAGFSMGGYGVYRTYLQQPELFSALAVFSGTPKVALPIRLALDGDFPSMLDEDNLQHFTEVPLFIHHGKHDRSLTPAATQELVTALEAAGACCVELHVEDTGHDSPTDPEILAAFHRWLTDTLH